MGVAALTYKMLVGEKSISGAWPSMLPRVPLSRRKCLCGPVVRGDLNGGGVDEALFGALAIDCDDRFDSVSCSPTTMLPHMGDAASARESAVLVGEACDDDKSRYCDERAQAASGFLAGERGGSYAGLSEHD